MAGRPSFTPKQRERERESDCNVTMNLYVDLHPTDSSRKRPRGFNDILSTLSRAVNGGKVPWQTFYICDSSAFTRCRRPGRRCSRVPTRPWTPDTCSDALVTDVTSQGLFHQNGFLPP
ncbi:hypothetical protein F2P81_020686 [Scophthalmus maximus]|uniref:Uncharacterized protein n=1 Tax=Scophthalmus maximus TaxID=52904 RepID=A0A6A4S6S0_SCOMX|nr:hypothetical protein F2P81_020686 [Scophthalmus maximus]